MLLYKDGNNWVFGATTDSVCPAGCFRLEPSYGRDAVTIRSIFDGKAFKFNEPVTSFMKAGGIPYADFDEFKAATAEFFGSSEPYPNAMTIPDEIDFTDETMIYKGYKRGNTYLVSLSRVTETTVSNSWAYGDWGAKEELFTP